MNHFNIADIRQEFVKLLDSQEYVIDKSGVKMLEIVNANFVADEKTIFGAVNEDYIARELEWYLSQSLNVNDIPRGTPAIWKQVADADGYINSNYGWCIFSHENNNQFFNVVTELENKPDSRRAAMIYTRPSMWGDHNKNGRSDFMCTNAVQYVIRNNKVHAIVQMRSNDVVFGFKNDYGWQSFVLDEVIRVLASRGAVHTRGDILWNAGSFHVYERHFNLVEEYANAIGSR